MAVGQMAEVELEARLEAPFQRHLIDGDRALAALASEASGQRGNSIVRASDTRPEPGSSTRANTGSATMTENAGPRPWRNAIASARPAKPAPPIKTSTRSLDRFVFAIGRVYH